MQVLERHVVSIDVLLDANGDHQISNNEPSHQKKHRFTILVGCNNKYPSRVSIRRNYAQGHNQNSTKRTLSTIDAVGAGSVQKYYFHHKNNQKSRSRAHDVQLTERKGQNGGTSSTHKIRDSNSKSYRIHTIDYVQQDKQEAYEPQPLKINKNALVDVTNKKQNYLQICKNKIKKKSIINQSDFTQFTTLIKNKKQKQELTINLKHRKFNKVKTQHEDKVDKQQEIGINPRKYHEIKYDYQVEQASPQKKNEKIYLLSERKPKQETSQGKRIQFKRSKIKNLFNLSGKDTVDLKQKQTIAVKQQLRESVIVTQRQQKCQKQSVINKNSEFHKYLNYIKKCKDKSQHHRLVKKQIGGQSMIVKSTVAKQTICLKLQDNANQVKEVFDGGSIKTTVILAQPPLKRTQHTQNSNNKHNLHPIFSTNQFECSSIRQINQSSFLSDTAKQQIIETNTFKLQQIAPFTCHDQPVAHNKKQNNIINNKYECLLVDISQQQAQPKKKRKKKQSKLGIMQNRADIKQVFPERFFI